MDKRQRSYRLFVGPNYIRTDPFQKTGELLGDGQTIEILPPFTVEFDINRKDLAAASEANIRIFNLNEDRRKRIYKDGQDFSLYKQVQLDAGYGTDLSNIFKGNIRQAYSVREGTNYITEINAFDGGDALINGTVEQSFLSGTPKNQIIDTVIGSMPNVTKGVVGQFEGSSLRGSVVSGNSANILKEMTNGGFFIDSEKVYCLNPEECVQGQVTVIDSDMGLLGTPKREGSVITVEILFEPRIKMAQIIQLNSITEKNYNSIYKVVGIKHRGTISDAICADAVTTLTLWVGPKQFRVVG